MKWAVGIKAPIYRVVNAIDPVTMLPTSDVFKDVFKDEFYKALSRIPVFGSSFKKSMMAKLSGYYHCGDMKYLTVCQPGDYDDVNLLYGVSFIFRVKTFVKNNMMIGQIPSDHSITVYRKKLSVIALRKN